VFRKLTLLLSLVFTFAFSTAALAQDIPAFDPAEMEGVESGYGRMYMVDWEMLLASPDAVEDMAADAPLVGMIGIFTFEDDDAAQSNLEPLGDSLTEQANDEGATLEKEEVDLGDEGYAYVGELPVDESESMNGAIIFVQQDEYIYFVMILGGEEPVDMGQEWTEYVLDGEIGDDAVELSEDGTSTGGVFDAMPTAEDEDLLGGMLPVSDSDLLEDGF
jgi:hypothetical protein